MKAIAVHQTGGIEQLKLLDLPVPEPAPDEILVRIEAAGVNEVDGMFREGYLDPGVRPLIMGSDFSGVIAQLGADVDDLAVGEEVYGYKLLGNGTYAEFTTINAAWIARKPVSISHAEAAAFPCVGLTAHQAVIDTLDVQPGELVLVTGAAGGVGTIAVQLAADRGARVIATASEPNHDYLRTLGAEAVIDYRDRDWSAAIKELYPDGVDAALATRGGETKQRTRDVLRDGGRLVWISGEEKPGPPMERMIAGGYVGGTPRRDTLRSLAELIDAGRLQLPIQQLYALTDAPAAQERVATGHVRGKLVIDITGTSSRDSESPAGETVA
jgi:NADPH:quinone reductase-like Zn-dependent oxidoreductase